MEITFLFLHQALSSLLLLLFMFELYFFFVICDILLLYVSVAVIMNANNLYKETWNAKQKQSFFVAEVKK